MTKKAVLELPEDFVREHILGVLLFPPAEPICNFDLRLRQNAAISETVDDPAGLLFGARRRVGRSEARGQPEGLPPSPDFRRSRAAAVQETVACLMSRIFRLT